MFKIKKDLLSFSLTLCSKALAQRQQEDIIYRSVRLTTFKDGNDSYVYLSSNGGYNGVRTAALPITGLTEELDVMVECQKLLDVVEKSTVEDITIEKINDENIKVIANGENKLRYASGELLAGFAKFDKTAPIGKMSVKLFSQLCKQTVPFATMDIHKAPLIGLCIDRNNLYSTDEFKAVTVEGVGLPVERQLNFSPIVADMIGLFDNEDTLQFFLGRMDESDEFTHLVVENDGMEMYILKYQTAYPSEILDTVNSQCKKLNVSSMAIPKGEALKALNRISVFADENDLLALTPQAGGVIMQVINAKTGEESKELIQAKVEGEEVTLNKKFYISLTNFKVLLENLTIDPILIRFKDNPQFISVVDSNYLCWLIAKKVE